MKNDQSERSGRSLSCGLALGTILLFAASACLGGCGSGDKNHASGADSGPTSDAGGPENRVGSQTDGAAPDAENPP